MLITWILALDRGHARIFERRNIESRFSLIETFRNPDGRKLPQDLLADRWGREGNALRVTEKGRRGGSTTAETENIRDTILQRFCREVVHYLQVAKQDNRFDKLVLVAEPHSLGVLRATLTEQLSAVVVAEVKKELREDEEANLLRNRLSGAIPFER